MVSPSPVGTPQNTATLRAIRRFTSSGMPESRLELTLACGFVFAAGLVFLPALVLALFAITGAEDVFLGSFAFLLRLLGSNGMRLSLDLVTITTHF